MTIARVPHPIPYQGSKRGLAPTIGNYVPHDIDVWFEPFAGSAAMSLWAARVRQPKKFVIADSLVPMASLWRQIISDPDTVADQYEKIWRGQLDQELDYFNRIRDRFNQYNDPVDLLYLTCRCVKNAIRFNRRGSFTQSVDKRRMGMKPDKMRRELHGASFLLRDRTEVREGDWLLTTADAAPADYVYMDPPYLGTSQGRDKRYAEWMSQERLIAGLREFRSRNLRFGLSYDGQSGERTYGPPLPEDLRLTRLLLHAGRSSQATLNGKRAETFESLYLSHGIGMGAESFSAPASARDLIAA
ncbi:DNA adenine methylase [Sphingopyxis kveilinensis]|uniref:DNA adenine methylase n=1 Tax=Sphingopyxis kveilinensis TaxID=3114367 RepID=UPI0030CD4854